MVTGFIQGGCRIRIDTTAAQSLQWFQEAPHSRFQRQVPGDKGPTLELGPDSRNRGPSMSGRQGSHQGSRFSHHLC